MELAKWESVGRIVPAKGTAPSNLRGLMKHEIILKAWGSMSDWLENMLEKKTEARSCKVLMYSSKDGKLFKTSDAFGAWKLHRQ